MKKTARIIMTALICIVMMAVPVISMAEVDNPVPGFNTDKNGNTYYYVENDKGNLVMKTGWTDIDGYKHYFDTTDGHMYTGIHKIGDYKYAFSSTTGHRLYGWQTIGGYKYYFNKENGRMFTGIHKIGDYKYAFSSTTGHRLYGWQTIGGYKYYFNKTNGRMYTGFKKIGDYTYYFSKKTGHRLYGWQTLDGKKYYFNKTNGRMYTGVHKIGSNVSTFSSSGVRTRIVYGSKKSICLTFDDGPSVNTTTILNTLKKYDGLATFFVVGDRTGTYRTQLKAAVKMGCQIGNHTQNHKMLASCTKTTIKSQISKCNSSVKTNGGVTPTICRTPGGEQTTKIKENVGMPIILWSVDTLDWKTQNSTSTYNAVMKGAKDGAVVLMHDLYAPTAEAVKKIVPALDKKGYQLVTIEEMRLLKGKSLKAGKIYYSFS